MTKLKLPKPSGFQESAEHYVNTTSALPTPPPGFPEGTYWSEEHKSFLAPGIHLAWNPKTYTKLTGKAAPQVAAGLRK